MTKDEKMKYKNAKPIGCLTCNKMNTCIEIMDIIEGFTPKIVVRVSDERTRLHRVKLHNKWRRMEIVDRVFTLYNHIYSLNDVVWM